MKRDLSFDRAIEFASDLIRIPSPPGGEGDVAERLRRELEMLRFDDVHVDAVGNVLGTARGTGGGPTVMLSSHLDVVDPGDPAAWQHGPYSGDIAGGFLHGRGAMDIKGPLALQTYAAAHFLDHPSDADVVVAHTVLEERGGWGMAHLLEGGSVHPAVVIVGEATAGDICIGHRGRAELVVEAHGVAGHASAPDRARNALDLVPDALRAVRDFAGRLSTDPVLGPATLIATGAETSPASPNVIPDIARITLDWRVLPGSSADRVLHDLEAFLRRRVRVADGFGLDVRFAVERQHTYTGLTRESRLFTPGFLLAPDHPVAVEAAGAVAAATGRRPAIRPWTFATDGGHSCGIHGIPTIGFAPGEERYAHTNRERLELAAARAAYDAYPAVIRAAAAAAAGDAA